MKKLVAFTCLVAAPLVGAGVASAGGDEGFNLTILPDQLDVGDPGFSLQYDPCVDGDLVEFTILETNASTTATCSEGVALASLDTPSQPGTYTVVASSTESNQAMGTIVVSQPSTGPESATTIALVGGIVLAAGVGLAGVARYRRRSI